MFWILAIFALGLLIVVHEAGHLLVARWSRMRVERFSVGFGPPIVSWKPGETIYQIAPVLFGGFVQITGMNPHEDFDPDDPRVYPNRPTWQRFLTIFAGPATNYLLAILLVFAVLVGAGVEDPARGWLLVGSVDKNAPAAEKLVAGDRIVEINGERMSLRADLPAGHGDFKKAVQSGGGGAVRVKVLRGGQSVEVEITPRLEKGLEPGAPDEYRVGIRLDREYERRRVGVAASAYWSLRYPVDKSGEILVGLWKIITREVPADVTGPIGITNVIRANIKAGWIRAFEVLALLSVYLGLFNLLPLPALDGGRLVFLGYELATRRRPNPRIETIVHTVGFVALSLLMILVFYKDIRSIWFN